MNNCDVNVGSVVYVTGAESVWEIFNGLSLTDQLRGLKELYNLIVDMTLFSSSVILEIWKENEIVEDCL